MRRPLIMLALCGLWASAAAAQAPADPGPQPEQRGPRAPARLFISPSGEPFRAGEPGRQPVAVATATPC